MELKNIRNFCIIAHIDHGKSTLADRFLEITGTVEKRKMHEQFLDQMDLERERGITIKMQPVRMTCEFSSVNYQLNLIDTPGHIDFSYEVSRALKAVEGAILLVDATQGVQAQTITNVEMAKSLGLVIIPVINKIDLPSAMIEETEREIINLLGCQKEDILKVSAKTGEGVEELLKCVIKRVPPPLPLKKENDAEFPRALVFDFEYSNHQGIIAYIRMIDGIIKKGDELVFYQTDEKFTVAEVGIFLPQKKNAPYLSVGEIGYVVTNIKKPSVAVVGDTIMRFDKNIEPLSGYFQPKPVVWTGIYPALRDGYSKINRGEDFNSLRQALERLRLSDSSLTFEEETNVAVGRGFKCGFLGMLHLEIITERLKREFGLHIITAHPTVAYKILFQDGKEKEIYSPVLFPDEHLAKKIFEQWVEMQIIIPSEKMNLIIPLLYEHEANIKESDIFGENHTFIKAEMPLRELIRNFFDDFKSLTSGYGSFSYKILDFREVEKGSIVRMDILVAEEVVPAFTKIISLKRANTEARKMVDKLAEIIPRQLFTVKIQARIKGRIIASRSISALKKDVTSYLYGGDRTRKMKLWEKQKRGKKKLKERGRVNIPPDVFIKMIQS